MLPLKSRQNAHCMLQCAHTAAQGCRHVVHWNLVAQQC